jgi:methyl-accepting chemotaxis protein
MNNPTSPVKPRRFRDSQKLRRVVTASVNAGVVDVRISNRDGRDEYRQLGIANFAVTDLEAVVSKLRKLLIQVQLKADEVEANYQVDEPMKEEGERS